MDEEQFRAIVRKELVPLLQGVLESNSVPSKPQEHLASYAGPCMLLLKPAREANYRVPISRSQPFTTQERDLVGLFITELATVAAMQAGECEADLLKAIPRRVVAKHLGGGIPLREVLEHLEDWSSQSYEGQRIVASIGLAVAPSSSGIPLAGLWDEPFGPVMSNGFDTIIIVGKNGAIRKFHQLSTKQLSSTAPYRLGAIACWARRTRISVVLNRHGEILVFQNKSLRFARRSGRWLHYVHETNIRRMSPPRDRILREAIYESCLDVSFARRGGCLGVIAQEHMHRLGKLVNEQDLLTLLRNYKTRLLARAINNRPFHLLDRRQRLELLSLDGAVILDRYGNVLSAGAILEVPAGSVGGGGRKAAAMKLSTFGLGLKISQDGTITGFRNEHEELRT